MTKKSFIKFLGLLLVVGLLFAVAPTGKAQAGTLDVCPTCTYTTIQAAINGAGLALMLKMLMSLTNTSI